MKDKGDIKVDKVEIEIPPFLQKWLRDAVKRTGESPEEIIGNLMVDESFMLMLQDYGKE